jgi:hypothetical protein
MAVEVRVRRQHRRRQTVYRREWSIGVGGTRVDFAAINGELTGFEIKSIRDNFGRLGSQVRMYNAVLDQAVLVVEGEAAAARAQSLVPEWWGLWLATETPTGAALVALREPTTNPRPDAAAIAQLLWRDEAYKMLHRLDLSAGLRTATRWRLWETLAKEVPLKQLQRNVRETIKARPGW